MKSCIGIFIGLLLSVSVSAESLLEGRVRLASGEPVAGVQVRLFDLADLRRSISATTDETGHFTLALQAFAPGSALPQGFALGQNYPNPFNPSTLIPYQIPTAAHVRLEMFNVLGQRVATLVDGEQSAGAHTAQWDATDAAGRAVGAGVYIYRLSSGGATVSRRMVLIDGQAGIPAAGAAGPMPMPASALERVDAAAGVYGLTVVGDGLVAYVNPAFRVGVAAADIVLEAHASQPRMKRMAGGILGDVNNDGQVDASDALYISLYSRNPSIVMPNNGDISLGDVNGDGAVNDDDVSLLFRFISDPSDPSLPAGIGQAVGDGTEAEEQAEENVPTRLTRNSADDWFPAWSPDGTQIAFQSYRDGNWEIYVMAADGSQPTRLTRNDAWDGSPAWSPDGTQIAFMSRRDGNWEIYVMAADGSQPTRLTRNDAWDGSPAWSPDGTQIAFDSYRDGNQEIYVMAADGSQPTRLTRNSAIDWSPAWSPDGTQIAFESIRDNTEIYVMAADGSQPTRLTRNDADDRSPAWSPDGTQIAFHSDRDGNREIYVMAADGSQPTRLTRNDAWNGSPAWSPDGTQIAFDSYRDGDFEIYVMAAKPETSGDSGGGGGGSSDDHSNTRSGATEVSLGSSHSGEIETGSDVDYFRVQVGESGTLTVYTTGNLDTKGELQSSSGSRLTSNDDGGSGSNFRIERSVSAGTYYVKVEGFSSSSTGSYTIHASFQSTSEGGNGGDNGDLSASNVNCSGSYLFGNSGSATITITGTVYAHRWVNSLRLIGYANGKRVGIDYIGILGAGESENFSISGIISTSGSSLNCSVEWEATVFNSAKVTAGDAESSQQVRVQGSLSPSSALINRKRSLEQP